MDDPTAQIPDDQQVVQITHQLQDEIATLEAQTKQSEEDKLHTIQQQAQQKQSTTQVRPSLQSLLGQQTSQFSDDASDDTTNQITQTRDKERQDEQVGTPSPERVPIREVQADFEPSGEIAEFVKPTPNPQTITLPKPVEDEYGDLLVQATQISKPNITLPVSEEEIEKAFHHKVADSVRWLAEWCHRNILLYPGRVFFKQE
ncbi:hypothetical protein GYA49_02455 [Candidatus Beckwithbacteria bacterium]|nr:hypothetical protein [Candidatus Beckwithbacteria bacterium]